MFSAGMSVLPQNCSQGAVKVLRIICQKKKKKEEEEEEEDNCKEKKKKIEEV